MDDELNNVTDVSDENIESLEDIDTVDTSAEEATSDEPEVELDPIEAMISSIEDKDFVNSSSIFNDLVADKLADAIDNKKIELANRMYNNATDEVDTEVDMEIDNEVEVEDEIV